MTGYTLHVGVLAEHIDQVSEMARRFSATAMHNDGTGFTAWSEPVGTEGNDDVTRLLSIDFGEWAGARGRAERMAEVLAESGILLPSLNMPLNPAFLWALTGSDLYDVVYHVEYV